MARVTLAYPYGDHSADETVDLEDDDAASLVRDGLARWPDDDEEDADADADAEPTGPQPGPAPEEG